MTRLFLLLVAASVTQAQQAPTWQLSARPTLDIGDDANVYTQFNGVTGLLRMPGGEIVVANGTSQELRVFSPAGAYVRTLTSSTRSGVMRSLDRIWRGGDTIFAAEILPDESNVWVFTISGFVAKRQVGSSNSGGIYPIERFPSGHFVVSAAPRRTSQPPVGLTFIDSVPLGLVAMEDRVPKWIGSLRNEKLVMPTIGRGRGAGGRTTIAYPYGRSTSYAVSGDRLWIGDSQTGTITQHNSTGRGVAVFSAPTPSRALDTAAIQRIRASLLSDAMNWNDRARVDAFYSLPFPRTAPRFARFVPSPNGEMWIEVFREDPGSGRGYVVVDRSGGTVARVLTAPRFTLLEVGISDVMGVLIDDDGLEHVVRYGLGRSPRQP